MDAEAQERTGKARRLWRRASRSALELLNRLRLPGPSVLPVAGAVVGLYAGLAAGLFANLTGLMGGLFFRLPHAFGAGWRLEGLREALLAVPWHTEYAIVGAPVAALALWAERRIQPGGLRDEVKRRLRVLALLVLGALGLYYPLVAVSALNAALGAGSIHEGLAALPAWAVVLLPLAGGALVGRMLRARPELHGHGVPEVVQTVRAERGLQGSGGLLKLVASAVTIGSGGSGGREGPIVYGGAAFASGVGETLGFSRRELAILLASGAGAGIAASFNAPIAGAIFGMEIILREFELKVFSPIILASVTATMVGRGLMHAAPMLKRLPYSMVSGWEVLAYAALGLWCGVLAYALIRCMHWVESLFGGRLGGSGSRVSQWLARRPSWLRAAVGGGLTGGMVLASPAVWGTGHEALNLAAEGKLGLWALVLGCGLKLLGTCFTIGSGGSGGTFFPATVVGGMAGGALGTVLHRLLPAAVAPSGAYALVGMGGAVAGLNRAPLTGMMMLYELSGNYAIILPLMVTCTIASALCHALSERRQRSVPTEAELLRVTPVRELMREAAPVGVSTPVRALMDLLVASQDFALPVRTGAGKIHGVVQLHHLQEVWPDAALREVLNAWDVAQPVPVLHPDADLRQAVGMMDEHDLDVLPVVEGEAVFLVTRAQVRRFLQKRRSPRQAEVHTVAPTELS